MIAFLRKQAPWWAIGLVLILPALGGGNSLLFGWPQASLIFTLSLAILLTDPDEPRRLPWWYWTLGAGLVVLGLVWLWPGPSLVFLSPNRADWPGPHGEISGIAANRVGTFESLFQALGFYAVLGIALLTLDRPSRRRSLMRWMLVCLGLVFVSALSIHFFNLNNHILPDVPVMYRDRLNSPFGGANLAAAFFISSLPFAAGMGLVHSPEERYLRFRRVWQMIGAVAFLCMLALQVMTQNRWMWVVLAPFLLGGGIWYVVRLGSRRQRLRAVFGIIAIAGLAAGYLALFNPGDVLNRFSLLRTQDESSEDRVLIFQTVWSTFLAYPWVGIGLGGFGEVCCTTTAEGLRFWGRYAHCEPLQWLAETGIIGMGLLIAVAGGMVQTIWRQVRDRAPWVERAPFAGGALLIAAACVVDFPLRCPALLFLFALYLGATLAGDRAPAAPVAAAAPTALAPAPGPSRWRRLMPAMALPAILVMILIGFLPHAASLFRRGEALAQFQVQSRSFKQGHDAKAITAAAENLLENAEREPYCSSEMIGILASFSNTPEEVARWEPQIEAILAGSPCNESLYYFQAVIALGQGDDERAAELSAKARLCAATNPNILRKIARVDWYLAAIAGEPGLRAARLNRAQETTRWLLMGNPEWAVEMASDCRQAGISLDDFLPALPATWESSGDLCQICIDQDRPLTALEIMAGHDLSARAGDASESLNSRVLTRWDVQVFTTTGQAAAAGERIARMYRETPASLRPKRVAEIRRQGWGVLTAPQWDHFAQQVEKAEPSAMERLELGRLFLTMGESDRALQCWLKAYKQERQPDLAMTLAQIFLANSAEGLAADYASEAVVLDPKNADAWRLLATVQVSQHDFLAAQKAFDRYRALAPERANGDFQLHGKILIGLGQAGGKPGK